MFEAGDHKALAASLRRLVSDRVLLGEMGRAALARAERYSPEAMAASLDTFLNQVRARAHEKYVGDPRLSVT